MAFRRDAQRPSFVLVPVIRSLGLIGLIVLIGLLGTAGAQTDALPSWNDGPAKQSIVTFIQTVTDRASPQFVPPEQRIATFDNDGTLWSEQPIYVQFAFALDRVKALAPKHPEWKTKQPFKAVLDGDMKALAASGERGMFQLLIATHTGMTTDEFTKTASDWIDTARHPRFKRPYTDLVYQPMLELLAHLRANGFKTYIVSGGTVEFMRPWTERVYGIPPEQVVGTSFVTTFKLGSDGKPMLLRQPKIDFVDDGPGKPVNIQKFIGRRPLLAFGNSDGDHQMLQWTAPARAPDSWDSSTTPTPYVNGPTTASRTSAAWTRRSTRRRGGAGRWST